jgi:predicted RNA-binding protein with PUA-like domain
MRHWLLKTEPDELSIADLRARGRAGWDGVRNGQAKNNLAAMKLGDLGLFYHSSVQPPGVVGVCRVVREAYPDVTAFDPESPYYDPKSDPKKPRWVMVDVEFVEELPRMVTLAELRAEPRLRDMVLVRPGRLSVQPVRPEEFETVLAMARSA